MIKVNQKTDSVRYYGRKWLVIATSIAALSACGDDDNDEKVQQLRGDLDQARAEIDALNEQVTELESKVKTLQPPDTVTDEPLALTILHMNDHHSHIAPGSFSYNVESLPLAARNAEGASISEVNVTYGGFPMLVSLFDQLSEQSENTVKIHAGDAITGTLYYSLFSGSADAAMMNRVCFDVFALGNHEFDDGDQALVNFIDDLRASTCDTKVLAANVVPGDQSPLKEGYLQPYMILQVAGKSVGFIGIDIADKTKNSSNPDAETQLLDEATTAQTTIDDLRSQGVNKIVLVTHYQYQNDIQLATMLSGVDVIVGGDSHTLLGSSTFNDLGFNPTGDYPTLTTNKDGERVCIVQAWEYAHLLGKLEVQFDSDGIVTGCEGHPMMPIADKFTYDHADGDVRSLDSADAFLVRQQLTSYTEVAATLPDSATEYLLSNYNEEVAVLEQEVIGTAAEDLCLVRIPGESRSSICDPSATAELGSDISNIVAKAFLMITPTADVAIQNAGGVRIDVAAGDITFAEAVNVLPFNNTLVTLDLTGEQIKTVLEQALANALRMGGSTGSYPYASGLRYFVDASQPEGARISNLQINPRLSGEWSPVVATETYTVVTNDFIASGQDGYTTFGEAFASGGYTDTFTLYTQAFIDYVKQIASEGQSLQKLPREQYSTQQYIDADGCNHSTEMCMGM